MLDKLWQVRAALGDINPLEDSSMVCQRLGIDVDMHRAMLKALLDYIAAAPPICGPRPASPNWTSSSSAAGASRAPA